MLKTFPSCLSTKIVVHFEDYSIIIISKMALLQSCCIATLTNVSVVAASRYILPQNVCEYEIEKSPTCVKRMEWCVYIGNTQELDSFSLFDDPIIYRQNRVKRTSILRTKLQGKLLKEWLAYFGK